MSAGEPSSAVRTPRTVLLGDLPINGRSTATTPRVLALHGWQRSERDFEWLFARPELADDGVAAIDLPGFGATPAPPASTPDRPWGSPEYAEQLGEVLAAKGWRDLVVVGHSFGGRVAVRLAARRPDLVAGVVLTGAPLIRVGSDQPGQPVRPARPPLAFRAAKALRRIGVVPESVLERYRQRHGSADYRAAGPVLRPILVKLVNETYDADLARIAQPVALVWGGRDTAAPAAQVDTLAGQLDVVYRHVAETAGHHTYHELRDELVDAVLAVRARIGGSA